jgi:peptidoglycan/LPS O-acetylase OafA/YrhL
MERENQQMQKTDNKRIVIGLVFITLAVILFADNFDFMPWNWQPYIFSLPMLVIVIGAISLARDESRSTGIILISVGAILLAVKILGHHYGIHHMFWPTVLAVIGVLLMVRKRNQHLFTGREKNCC